MLLDRPGQLPLRRHDGELRGLLPEPTTDTAPHYGALAGGRLELQCCTRCGKIRYPLGPVCPWCHAGDFRWAVVSGAGLVHSWVRYHRAFVPAFAHLVPYDVVHVQLDDGPRMTGWYAGATPVRTGLRVQACLERWDDDGTAICFDSDPEPQ